MVASFHKDEHILTLYPSCAQSFFFHPTGLARRFPLKKPSQEFHKPKKGEKTAEK
jgi:hypothetical protein